MENWYTKKDLWLLFLMCAFPLHIWTLFLFFRDFSWLTERTNMWDALGVGSYGLVYTFIESVLVFLLVAALGLLVSKTWSRQQRLALLISLLFLTSLWAMFNQLVFINQLKVLPPGWISFFAMQAHPLRLLYLFVMIVVGITAVPLAYVSLFSEKYANFIARMAEQLSLLTLFYFFFDVLGLIVVIVRNI